MRTHLTAVTHVQIQGKPKHPTPAGREFAFLPAWFGSVRPLGVKSHNRAMHSLEIMEVDCWNGHFNQKCYLRSTVTTQLKTSRKRRNS